jgi:TctA family transporter
MSMSQGNIYVFLSHPIVATFLILSVAFLFLPAFMRSRGGPRQLVDDD